MILLSGSLTGVNSKIIINVNSCNTIAWEHYRGRIRIYLLVVKERNTIHPEINKEKHKRAIWCQFAFQKSCRIITNSFSFRLNNFLTTSCDANGKSVTRSSLSPRNRLLLKGDNSSCAFSSFIAISKSFELVSENCRFLLTNTMRIAYLFKFLYIRQNYNIYHSVKETLPHHPW